MSRQRRRRTAVAVAASGMMVLALLATLQPSSAQGGQGGAAAPQAPRTARATAPVDLTGTWVSVISEEWRWRMLTPPKGDYASIPLTDAARAVGDAWDPAKDTAAGNACRAYGAIGIMQLPIRMRVSWQDENTLKMEIDAGSQTRVFRFGDNLRPPAGAPGWQGFSAARWQAPGGGDVRGRAAGGGAAGAAAPPPATGGSLLVETTNLRPGYMRKNGIPYSENARLTERLFVLGAADGNQWLMLMRTVQDATYLNGDYVSSWHFKREANDAKFRPTPCSAS